MALKVPTRRIASLLRRAAEPKPAAAARRPAAPAPGQSGFDRPVTKGLPRAGAPAARPAPQPFFERFLEDQHLPC